MGHHLSKQKQSKSQQVSNISAKTKLQLQKIKEGEAAATATATTINWQVANELDEELELELDSPSPRIIIKIQLAKMENNNSNSCCSSNAILENDNCDGAVTSLNNQTTAGAATVDSNANEPQILNVTLSNNNLAGSNSNNITTEHSNVDGGANAFDESEMALATLLRRRRSSSADGVDYCEVLEQQPTPPPTPPPPSSQLAVAAAAAAAAPPTLSATTRRSSVGEMLSSNAHHRAQGSNSCCRSRSNKSGTTSTATTTTTGGSSKRRCCKCKCRDYFRGVRGIFEKKEESSAAASTTKTAAAAMSNTSTTNTTNTTTTTSGRKSRSNVDRRSTPVGGTLTTTTTANSVAAAAVRQQAQRKRNSVAVPDAATNQVAIWAPAAAAAAAAGGGDVIIRISSPQFVVEPTTVTVGAVGAVRLEHPLQQQRSGGYVVHSQIDFMHCLVPDLEQIINSSFYWGKMDRYEAERLLEGKPEGTFLLRDSAQEEFLFSVTFRKYGRSLHARIEQSGHKFSFDCHDPCVFTAPTVTGLLEHYKDPSCVMFFEPCLTMPLHRRQTFSLQQLSRATIVSNTTYDGINQLELPGRLKAYLKEYHYKQKLRVKPCDTHTMLPYYANV